MGRFRVQGLDAIEGTGSRKVHVQGIWSRIVKRFMFRVCRAKGFMLGLGSEVLARTFLR